VIQLFVCAEVNGPACNKTILFGLTFDKGSSFTCTCKHQISPQNPPQVLIWCVLHVLSPDKIVVKIFFISSGDVKYMHWGEFTNQLLFSFKCCITCTSHGHCFIIWLINSSLLTLSIFCVVFESYLIPEEIILLRCSNFKLKFDVLS